MPQKLNLMERSQAYDCVKSEVNFRVNSSDNLAKYADFSFQPIGVLELRNMTSERRIMFKEWNVQVSLLPVITNE